MIGRTLKRLFARFGYRYGYDTSYMQNLVDSDRNGATKLALASLFTRYRFGLPPAPYFAAKIIATRYADSGSCLKLAIDMAAEAGVPLAHIRRLLLGPEEEAPPEMRLAARYARAVSENDPALSDIIEDCTRRWGKRGLAGLAAAVTSGQFYPLFKRGLGHGNTCTPVLAWLRTVEAAPIENTTDVLRARQEPTAG